MIALLGLCPIRLKNFSALALGTSIRKFENSWWIILSAPEAKARRPDEREVPGMLTPYLDHYVQVVRLILHRRSNALWIGMYGEAMSYSAVESAITKSTKAALGVAVSPHLFRSSAASSAYRHASQSPHLASALLQHTHPKTTQEHYNKAQSAGYAMAFSDLITQRKV